MGAHYLTFIRRPLPSKYSTTKTAKWVLINDEKCTMMEDWAQLVGYCVESRCMPTLLVYEEYSNEASMSITMSRMYSLKDEIDMTRPEWENL